MANTETSQVAQVPAVKRRMWWMIYEMRCGRCGCELTRLKNKIARCIGCDLVYSWARTPSGRVLLSENFKEGFFRIKARTIPAVGGPYSVCPICNRELLADHRYRCVCDLKYHRNLAGELDAVAEYPKLKSGVSIKIEGVSHTTSS